MPPASKKKWTVNDIPQATRTSFEAIFKTMDKANTGYIEYDQLVNGYLKGDSSMTKEEKQKFLKESVDHNADGKVSFDEFAKWLYFA